MHSINILIPKNGRGLPLWETGTTLNAFIFLNVKCLFYTSEKKMPKYCPELD